MLSPYFWIKLRVFLYYRFLTILENLFLLTKTKFVVSKNYAKYLIAFVNRIRGPSSAKFWFSEQSAAKYKGVF